MENPQQHDSLGQHWDRFRGLWKEKTVFGIERWLTSLFLLVRYLTPSLYLAHACRRCPYPWNKLAIEWYTFTTLGVLWWLAASGGTTTVSLQVLVSVVLVDMFLSLLGGSLLVRPGLYEPPVSSTRTLILVLLNFGHLTLAFAALYLGCRSLCFGTTPVTSWQHAWYFSVVTAATVGYGDISPCTDGGRALAGLQIYSSLLYASIVLSIVASRAAAPKN